MNKYLNIKEITFVLVGILAEISYLYFMVKVDLAAILRSQLEMANATNLQLLSRLESQDKTIRELQATVRSLESTIKSLEDTLLKKDEALESVQAQKDALGNLLEKKNEKVRTMPVARTSEELAAIEHRREEERKRRGNNGAKRNMHYEMAVVEEDIYPGNPEYLNADQKDVVAIGSRQCIRYRMIPPRFEKVIYTNHAYRVGDIVYSGVLPRAPFQNSCYESSCIAGIAELRYVQSMPVERIVTYFHDHGFELDKNTAHNLLKSAADLLDPLYRALAKAVKDNTYIICDETYHKVLVKVLENEGSGSKKAYLWGMVAPLAGLAYFFYDEGSRSEEVILNELEGYRGNLQSDGLKAYKKVAAHSGGAVARLACLQHCKRDFVSLQGNPDADNILSLSNQLYSSEHMHEIGIEGWTAEDNLRWRRKYAPPILMKLKAVLEKVKEDTVKYPPKSKMYKAARYFLNEFDGIEAIFRTGECDLDTNRIERLNRYVSLSRRNSLFFGSHDGAARGALFYSLSCSCKLRGINFFEYLSDVLDRVAAMSPASPVESYRPLLPDMWSKA